MSLTTSWIRCAMIKPCLGFPVSLLQDMPMIVISVVLTNCHNSERARRFPQRISSLMNCYILILPSAICFLVAASQRSSTLFMMVPDLCGCFALPARYHRFTSFDGLLLACVRKILSCFRFEWKSMAPLLDQLPFHLSLETRSKSILRQHAGMRHSLMTRSKFPTVHSPNTLGA
jgi:hypothetical protein